VRSSSARARKPQPCFLCYPKQAAFLSATEPIRGFVAGQGSGKSKVGAYDLLQRALDGRTYMVTGPTYKVLGQATIRTFVETAREFGRLVRVTRSANNPSALIRLAPPRKGLAEVLFRSTDDPDHLRGPNLSGLWMDEASLAPLEAYQICVARLREAREVGWLSATFTPKGLSHWTYDVFGNERPDTFLVQARTDENPFVAEGFISLVKSAYSGLRAMQELEGRFVSIEGAEWPPEYFSDDLWFRDWPDLPWQAAAMALDPSKGQETTKPKQGRLPDFSAYVWGACDHKGTVWVDANLDQVRDVHQMVRDGIGLFRSCPFRLHALTIETNQFQSLLAPEFQRQADALKLHLPLYGLDNYENKRVRIRTIGPYLACRELRFRDTPGCRRLVGQLRDFPCGDYDDGPDALEMCLRTLLYLVSGQQGAGQPKLLRA
jgi:phage terminase large subunit-like protein